MPIERIHVLLFNIFAGACLHMPGPVAMLLRTINHLGNAMKRLLALLLSSLVSVGASAQTTYTYTSVGFVTVSAPYTTANNIKGSFQLAAPLPANAPLTDISALVQSFSFTDGIATRNQSNSVICGFQASTNPAGGIQYYNVFLRQSNTTAMQNQHSLEAIQNSKSGTLLAGTSSVTGGTGCGPISLDPFANTSGASVGVWAGGPIVTNRAIPALSIGGIMLLGSLLILLMWRRRSVLD